MLGFQDENVAVQAYKTTYEIQRRTSPMRFHLESCLFRNQSLHPAARPPTTSVTATSACVLPPSKPARDSTMSDPALGCSS